MASSSGTDAPPAKRTFIVWISDCTDADALARRLAVRPAHAERVKQLAADGSIKIGGPLLDPESGEMNGSVLVFEAESAAAVRSMIEEDVYWTTNVWDKEKLDIRAMQIAVNVQGARA